MALCLFNAGLAGVSLLVTICYYGETTVMQRIVRHYRDRRAVSPANDAAAAA